MASEVALYKSTATLFPGGLAAASPAAWIGPAG